MGLGEEDTTPRKATKKVYLGTNAGHKQGM